MNLNFKRKKYLSWDAYFMSVAFMSSLRSKDPNTRNGACIVNNKKKIIGTGYNGFPQGCSDDDFPWDRSAKDPYDSKYPYVLHAEVNSILNATRTTDGCRMYFFSEKGYYPCCECGKIIVQCGIKEIIMVSESKSTDKFDWRPTLRMFKAAKVEVILMPAEDVKRMFSYVIEETTAFFNAFVV